MADPLISPSCSPLSLPLKAADVAQIFEKYDQKHDGKLTKSMISTMLKDLNFPEEKFNELYEASDVNDDGVLTRDEFTEYFNSLNQKVLDTAMPSIREYTHKFLAEQQEALKIELAKMQEASAKRLEEVREIQIHRERRFPPTTRKKKRTNLLFLPIPLHSTPSLPQPQQIKGKAEAEAVHEKLVSETELSAELEKERQKRVEAELAREKELEKRIREELQHKTQLVNHCVKMEKERKKKNIKARLEKRKRAKKQQMIDDFVSDIVL